MPPSVRNIRLASIATLLALALALLPAGCKKAGEARVVLYTSVDQPVAEPVVREFERRTGIKVDLQTDTEATKSAGLAARLQAERDNPKADVWWGNEVFHTINLADNGVLAPYDSPSAADVPAKFKDPDRRWTGSALRARVIAYHTGLADVKPSTRPAAGGDAPAHGLTDLTDPAFRNR